MECDDGGSCSTSPPSGNQVDGLPLVLHQLLATLRPRQADDEQKWCEALSHNRLRAKIPKSSGKAGTSTFLEFINEVSISNLEKFPEKTLGEFMSSFISCKFQPKCIVVELENKQRADHFRELENVKILNFQKSNYFHFQSIKIIIPVLSSVIKCSRWRSE